jgi:hypothetical protein
LKLRNTVGGTDAFSSIFMDSNNSLSTKSLWIHYGGNAGYNNQLRFGRSGDNFGGWEANPVIFDMDAPDASLFVTENGNVGIGTAGPEATLHVSGTILATKSATVSDCNDATDDGKLRRNVTTGRYQFCRWTP